MVVVVEVSGIVVMEVSVVVVVEVSVVLVVQVSVVGLVEVSRVVVADEYVRATLKSPDATGRTQLVAVRVDPALVGELRARGVEFSGEVRSDWIDTLLSWVLPFSAPEIIFRGMPCPSPEKVVSFMFPPRVFISPKSSAFRS